MKKIALEDIPHLGHPAEVNTVRRPISDALNATDVAVIYYELEPGDSFSGGLHRHHDQEEIFYILSGEATFDVRESIDTETWTITVTAGEIIRIPPGEFQYGYNAADKQLVALTIAAPGSEHDWDELEWLTRCRNCDEEVIHDVQLNDTRQIVATCRQCGKAVTTR